MPELENSFADTSVARQKIVETIMREGNVSNACATAIAAGVYLAGFKFVSIDKLTAAITRHGHIPHMTHRP